MVDIISFVDTLGHFTTQYGGVGPKMELLKIQYSNSD